MSGDGHFFVQPTGSTTWYRVDRPPDSGNGGHFGAYFGSGAAGDVLYVAGGYGNGARVLWVGRFEPEG